MSQTKLSGRSLKVPEAPAFQYEKAQIGGADQQVDTLIHTTQARQSFQVDGSGITVAILDTGLRATHKDFEGRVRTQVNFTEDNNSAENNATDENGHGTHVTGIVAGAGRHRGIAPGSGIVPIKVLANTKNGTFETLDRGLSWVIDNWEKYSISVLCMSLGDGYNETDDTSFADTNTAKLIAQLINLNVAVVIAAGNDYYTHNQGNSYGPGKQGMAFPSILRSVISVGAVYDADVGKQEYGSGARANITHADRITPFSQRLHPSTGGECYTDIFAPGAPVASSGILTDQGEAVHSGTSQATPVVAGIILLLHEYHKRLTNGKLPSVETVTHCLRSGAVRIYDNDAGEDNVPDTGKEYLRIDALGSLEAMRRVLLNQVLFTKRAL